MALNLTSILGDNLGEIFSKIVGTFKLSPDKAAELESLKLQNAQGLAVLQAQMDEKLQDSISNEIESSAEIIKAEAGSQSWLPKNVRPFLLMIWGLAITIHALGLTAVINHWTGAGIPATLDPWVYKLTAIGFTGYVTARTWEKVKNADN